MATTLPKDFREYGDAYSLIELQEIFESRPLDARGGYRKQTALAYSTVTAEVVTWLLDHGADIEAEDQFSASPLVTRAAEGDLEIVDLLIKRGADPIRAGSRHTPLCAAAACTPSRARRRRGDHRHYLGMEEAVLRTVGDPCAGLRTLRECAG